MACFIILLKTRLIQQPNKILTTSFGFIKLQIWICYTETSKESATQWPEMWEGEADTRDPRDRETETGETLVAGETRRRRGLGRIQGHQRVPLIKTTLLTYFTHALLEPRVLVVGNGGSAALRGVTPADLGNGDAIELADEQERLKAKL